MTDLFLNLYRTLVMPYKAKCIIFFRFILIFHNNNNPIILRNVLILVTSRYRLKKYSASKIIKSQNILKNSAL